MTSRKATVSFLLSASPLAPERDERNVPMHLLWKDNPWLNSSHEQWGRATTERDKVHACRPAWQLLEMHPSPAELFVDDGRRCHHFATALLQGEEKKGRRGNTGCALGK